MTSLALMCSGQGEQQVDMIENLRPYQAAAALLDSVSEALLPEVRSWIDSPDENGIYDEAICQQLICLRQLMVWEVVRAAVPPPAVFMGYSLGELTAYGCSGACSPATVLRLAAKRGKYMRMAAQTPSAGMAAVKGLGRDTVTDICNTGSGFLAIVNGPDHFVIGAEISALDQLTATLESAGASTVTKLKVPLASHTPLMASAAKAFHDSLEQEQISPGGTFITSCLNGEAVFSGKQAVEALSAQICSTLRFDLALGTAVSRGCRIFLELGPGKDLSHIVLESNPDFESRSVDEFADLNKVGKWVEAAIRRQG